MNCIWRVLPGQENHWEGNKQPPLMRDESSEGPSSLGSFPNLNLTCFLDFKQVTLKQWFSAWGEGDLLLGGHQVIARDILVVTCGEREGDNSILGRETRNAAKYAECTRLPLPLP